MKRSSTRQSGRGLHAAFTLIEVLVVVAIIALLISILLPSLRAAREEAKKVLCVSNLHQIGVANSSYLLANRNRFPWGPSASSVFSHYWAGNSDKGDGPNGGNWSKWYGPASSRYTPAGSRPVNKYLVARTIGKKADADLEVFRCPNDDGVRSRGNYDEPKSTNSCYYVIGASYESNIIWSLYMSQKENYSGAELTARQQFLMDRIVFLFEKKGPSRAVMAYEDPADCTLGGVLWNWHPDLKYMGWHNRPNYYSCAFLDGHAENLYMAHKKVLDFNYGGAGGQLNLNCNPSSGKCYNGDSRWVVRQDWRDE